MELSEEDSEDLPRNIVSSVGWIHSWEVPPGICWAGWESTKIDTLVLCAEGEDEYAVNGGDGSFGGVRPQRTGRRMSEDGEGLLGRSSAEHTDTGGDTKSVCWLLHSLLDTHWERSREKPVRIYGTLVMNNRRELVSMQGPYVHLKT